MEGLPAKLRDPLSARCCTAQRLRVAEATQRSRATSVLARLTCCWCVRAKDAKTGKPYYPETVSPFARYWRKAGGPRVAVFRRTGGHPATRSQDAYTWLPRCRTPGPLAYREPFIRTR